MLRRHIENNIAGQAFRRANLTGETQPLRDTGSILRFVIRLPGVIHKGERRNGLAGLRRTAIHHGKMHDEEALFRHARIRTFHQVLSLINVVNQGTDLNPLPDLVVSDQTLVSRALTSGEPS